MKLHARTIMVLRIGKKSGNDLHVFGD
jgi:hypothetical protein